MHPLPYQQRLLFKCFNYFFLSVDSWPSGILANKFMFYTFRNASKNHTLMLAEYVVVFFSFFFISCSRFDN